MTFSQKKNTPPSVRFDAADFWIEGTCGPFLVGSRASCRNSSICKIVLPHQGEPFFSWESAIAEAKCTQKWILWDMDFSPIAPLITSGNLQQEKAKELAVKYFLEKVYPHFLDKTIGILLHKGPLGFTEKTREKRKEASLFFLDRLAEFSQFIPDELPMFLLFSTGKLSPFEAASLLHQKYFGNFVLVLEGASFPFPAFSWGPGLGNYGYILQQEKIGFLLPESPCDHLFELLNSVPYRILYPEFANQDWFDLDAIFFAEKTERVKRILQGFQAAGGAILSEKGTFGYEGEISLEKYLNNRGRGI